jgi:hypothetical protein
MQFVEFSSKYRDHLRDFRTLVRGREFAIEIFDFWIDDDECEEPWIARDNLPALRTIIWPRENDPLSSEQRKKANS